MTEKPAIQISLTAEQKAQIQRQTGKQIRKQQLEILAATGLLVRTLELPVAAPAEGEGALARLPMPEWLRSPKS
jgi:hypothetical protein